MPRRAKDDTVTDTQEAAVASTDTVTAGGSVETNGADEKPKRSSVDDLPLGNTTTRTGAAATVIQGPKGKRVFTAGGDKGAKIAELLKTKPEMSRKDIAGLVGCSQSRVAEVARVLGLSVARPQTSTGPSDGEAEAESASPSAEAESAPAPQSVST